VKVLVTFAVPAEFAPWRARHSFHRVADKFLTCYEADIADAKIMVLLTGVGGDFAAARVRMVMSPELGKRKFKFCVSTGLAGALRAEHRPGDVLVAHGVQAETVRHAGASNEVFGDAELGILAVDCGAKLVGRFHTSSRIVQTSTAKTALGSMADAVEMESFDIFREAQAWGSRSVAIRAISDSVTEDLPIDFSKTLTKLGEVSVSRLVLEIARRPNRLPSLVRFGRQSRRAATALADFLDRYVGGLGAVGLPRTPQREVVAV